jgi:hypothetical protein
MIDGKMIETQVVALSYHFAHNHFAESFPSSPPGRREFFRKKTIPDMCSTDSTDEEKKGTWVEAKRHEARTDRFFS